MPVPHLRFEPTEYSVEELRFLLTELGKPPVIIREMKLPPGVVLVQVLKLVTQCYELEEKLAHSGIPWAGYRLVKEKIENTLKWYQICAELARRGGPKHPSQHTWDRNRYVPRGVGSDSGIVRTAILPDGSREPLGLDLLSPDGQGVGPNLIGAAPWLEPGGGSRQALLDATPSAFLFAENAEAQTGSVTCPICEWTESYGLQSSAAKNLAVARMKSHLKRAKTEKDAHAILYSRVSGKSVAA